MDFISVLEFLLTQLRKESVDFAFIGGFALQAAGISRSTGDIDFLVPSQDAEKIRKIMALKGYKLLHESPDVLNFLGESSALGRVDFLLAHRKYALAMLARANHKKVLDAMDVKVVRPEDLIGLKVQAVANTPERRDKDFGDVRELLKMHRATLDLELIREYFRIFGMEPDLDKLLQGTSPAPEP